MFEDENEMLKIMFCSTSKSRRTIRVFNSFIRVSLRIRESFRMGLMLCIVVDDYGLETVQNYMYHIRNNAEMSVRNLLKDVAKKNGSNVLSAIDYLDDGSPVCAPPFFVPLFQLHTIDIPMQVYTPPKVSVH